LGIQDPGVNYATTNAEAFDLYLKGIQADVVDGDIGLAESLWQESIAEDPRFPLPYAKLCQYHISRYESVSELAEFENAERYCFRALTLNSNAPEFYNALGRLYYASGQPDRAREQYNQALAINPEYYDSRLELARTYFGDNQTMAESLLRSIIRDYPGSPGGYNGLQFLLFNQGRYAEAIEPATQGLRLDPDNVRNKLNLSSNLTLAGRFADAAELLEDLLREDSLLIGDISSNLAAIHYFEGEYAQAANLFTTARAEEPESALIARNLADTLWHQSGAEEAADLFLEVVDLAESHLEINPENEDAISSLIIAYGSLGYQDQLETILQEASDASNSNPQFHYDVAIAYSRLGESQLARQHATMAEEQVYPSAWLAADPDLQELD